MAVKCGQLAKIDSIHRVGGTLSCGNVLVEHGLLLVRIQETVETVAMHVPINKNAM